MDVVDFLNEKLLSFADDIVPVDKQEIIDFFHSINRPYNEDYVNLLSRIGGNKEAKIITWVGPALLINFSFKSLKDTYTVDLSIDDFYLPNHFCYFGSSMTSVYIIHSCTGVIYDDGFQFTYTDDYELIRVEPTSHELPDEDIVFSSVKAFLFCLVQYYLDRVSSHVSSEEIYIEDASFFRQKNEQYRLSSADNKHEDYYIIGDKLCYLTKWVGYPEEPSWRYIDNEFKFSRWKINILVTYQFTPEFYKELQDFKKAHNLE